MKPRAASGSFPPSASVCTSREGECRNHEDRQQISYCGAVLIPKFVARPIPNDANFRIGTPVEPSYPTVGHQPGCNRDSTVRFASPAPCRSLNAIGVHIRGRDRHSGRSPAVRAGLRCCPASPGIRDGACSAGRRLSPAPSPRHRICAPPPPGRPSFAPSSDQTERSAATPFPFSANAVQMGQTPCLLSLRIRESTQSPAYVRMSSARLNVACGRGQASGGAGGHGDALRRRRRGFIESLELF